MDFHPFLYLTYIKQNRRKEWGTIFKKYSSAVDDDDSIPVNEIVRLYGKSSSKIKDRNGKNCSGSKKSEKERHLKKKRKKLEDKCKKVTYTISSKVRRQKNNVTKKNKEDAAKLGGKEKKIADRDILISNRQICLLKKRSCSISSTNASVKQFKENIQPKFDKSIKGNIKHLKKNARAKVLKNDKCDNVCVAELKQCKKMSSKMRNTTGLLNVSTKDNFKQCKDKTKRSPKLFNGETLSKTKKSSKSTENNSNQSIPKPLQNSPLKMCINIKEIESNTLNCRRSPRLLNKSFLLNSAVVVAKHVTGNSSKHDDTKREESAKSCKSFELLKQSKKLSPKYRKSTYNPTHSSLDDTNESCKLIKNEHMTRSQMKLNIKNNNANEETQTLKPIIKIEKEPVPLACRSSLRKRISNPSYSELCLKTNKLTPIITQLNQRGLDVEDATNLSLPLLNKQRESLSISEKLKRINLLSPQHKKKQMETQMYIVHNFFKEDMEMVHKNNEVFPHNLSFKRKRKQLETRNEVEESYSKQESFIRDPLEIIKREDSRDSPVFSHNFSFKRKRKPLQTKNKVEENKIKEESSVDDSTIETIGIIKREDSSDRPVFSHNFSFKRKRKPLQTKDKVEESKIKEESSVDDSTIETIEIIKREDFSDRSANPIADEETLMIMRLVEDELKSCLGFMVYKRYEAQMLVKQNKPNNFSYWHQAVVKELRQLSNKIPLRKLHGYMKWSIDKNLICT